MKTMGCSKDYRPSLIQSVIPGFKDAPSEYDNRFATTGNPKHSQNTYALHYLVGKKNGIKDEEWTMRGSRKIRLTPLMYR